MICPKCRINHKKKYGLRCNCGYQFVFSPDMNKGMTDNKFLSLIKKASADDRYYFTFSQLYLARCKMKGETNIGGILAWYIIAGLFFGSIFPPVLFLIAATGGVHIINTFAKIHFGRFLTKE
jgi:hypothetical protein